MDFTTDDNQSFTCKICLISYDEKIRIPKVIACGHTLCSPCLNAFTSKASLTKEYTCPFCMKKIPLSFESIVNYEILSSQKQSTKASEDSCKFHKEELIFLCLDCDKSICQKCILEIHLGHKIGKSDSKKVAVIEKLFTQLEQKIKNSRFEKECDSQIYQDGDFYNRCIQLINSINTNLNFAKMVHKYEFSINKEEIEILKQEFKGKMENKVLNREKFLNEIEKKLLRLDTKINSYDNKTSLEWTSELKNIKYENINFLGRKRDTDVQFTVFPGSYVSPLESLYLELGKIEKVVVSACHKITKKYDYLNEINKEDLINYFQTMDYTKVKYKPSKSIKNTILFENVAQKLKIKSLNLISIFLSIDRKDFCDVSVINEKKEYEDCKVGVGNRILISPTTQVKTLNYICEYFKYKRGLKKVLKIGSHSGFLTLCLSKFLGLNSVVHVLESMKEKVSYSQENIKKNNENYIINERIKFHLKNEQEGLIDEAPFDVICFDSPQAEIPQKIVDQLEVGGIIWIPLGNRTGGNLTIARKEKNGSILKFDSKESYGIVPNKYPSNMYI
jgi:protein-L-isoaspartate(D-aspartate) O-methyltransferase